MQDVKIGVLALKSLRAPIGQRADGKIEIRQGDSDDWIDLVDAQARAFGNPRGPEVVKRWQREVDLEDVVVAEETRDGRRAVVGTVMFYRFPLTVPGGAAVGLAGVGMGLVAATHQRQGIYRAMFMRLIDNAVRLGLPLLGGMPSKGGIYRRFGLGPSTYSHEIVLDRTCAILAYSGDPAATVRELGAEEARRLAPLLHSRWAEAAVGSVGRSAEWWENYFDEDFEKHSSGERFFMGHHDGYLSYRLVTVGAATEVLVDDFCALTPEAHTDLWQSLLGLEMFDVIRAEVRTDDPLFLKLMDMRAVQVTRRKDVLWTRILDVAKALSIRSYAADDSVILTVNDPLQLAGGTFELATSGGAGVCRPTEATPDIVLDIDDLASLYLGATTPKQLLAAHRLKVTSNRSVTRFSAMLRTDEQPFCNTYF